MKLRPFFSDTARQEALFAEAKRWEHTPFVARQASCGFAVDCVNLQLELFVAVGALQRMPLPDYTLDRAKHSTRTQLLQFLLTDPALAGRFVMVPHAAPRLPGDLLGIQSGRVDHHLASVQLWGKVFHAIEKHGAIFTEATDDELVRRTLYVLRLMEVRG